MKKRELLFIVKPTLMQEALILAQNCGDAERCLEEQPITCGMPARVVGITFEECPSLIIRRP